MSATGLAAKQTEEADRRITRKAWEEAPATRDVPCTTSCSSTSSITLMFKTWSKKTS
ncbi:BnaC04g53400D [Brassica napus]|uniref:BnaC04g53400D protein n=1 Tax=Brassica napus TaxID=3708 RepID=A0A078J875_BRANA|nr:BnaC04g53400D [Brassica napus]